MRSRHETRKLPKPLQRGHQVLRRLDLDRPRLRAALDANVEQMRDRSAVPALSGVVIAVRQTNRCIERPGPEHALDDGAAGNGDRESESADFAATVYGHLDKSATSSVTRPPSVSTFMSPSRSGR